MGPALFLHQLGMDEIESVERVLLVLDPAVHVHAAAPARVALNRRRRVDDLQLVCVLGHTQLVARHHRDHREQGALWFPALGATAHVIVCDITLDPDLDPPVGAFADEGAAGEALSAVFHAAINGRMNRNSHCCQPPLVTSMGGTGRLARCGLSHVMMRFGAKPRKGRMASCGEWRRGAPEASVGVGSPRLIAIRRLG